MALDLEPCSDGQIETAAKNGRHFDNDTTLKAFFLSLWPLLGGLFEERS